MQFEIEKSFYDQAGKSQLLADVADYATTTYIDTDILGGTPHGYEVTSYNPECESDFSNVLCATPYVPGDLDGNWDVELTDGILSLQLFAGLPPTVEIQTCADVDSNAILGLQEAIYILQIIAEIR